MGFQATQCFGVSTGGKSQGNSGRPVTALKRCIVTQANKDKLISILWV